LSIKFKLTKHHDCYVNVLGVTKVSSDGNENYVCHFWNRQKRKPL